MTSGGVSFRKFLGGDESYFFTPPPDGPPGRFPVIDTVQETRAPLVSE